MSALNPENKISDKHGIGYLCRLIKLQAKNVIKICKNKAIIAAKWFLHFSYCFIIPFLLQIDVVDQPSWQAQLRGSQRWFLHPPPECYYQCESLEVTLNPGEISKLKKILLLFGLTYHSNLLVIHRSNICSYFLVFFRIDTGRF